MLRTLCRSRIALALVEEKVPFTRSKRAPSAPAVLPRATLPTRGALFIGDNGMNMGHHGIYGKGNGTYPLNMYDTAVKVPAIISQPGRVPATVIDENMHSHYDFLPTLLDYLGLGDAAPALGNLDLPRL